MDIKFGPFVNNVCKNGHPKIKENIGWITYRKNKRSPTCKRCRAINAKIKYRENGEYRERKKSISRAYYHRVKAKNAVQDPRQG